MMALALMLRTVEGNVRRGCGFSGTSFEKAKEAYSGSLGAHNYPNMLLKNSVHHMTVIFRVCAANSPWPCFTITVNGVHTDFVSLDSDLQTTFSSYLSDFTWQQYSR